MIIVINGRVFPTHPDALKGRTTAEFLFRLFNMQPSEGGPSKHRALHVVPATHGPEELHD